MAQIDQNFEMWQGDHKVLAFTVVDVESLEGATIRWAAAYLSPYKPVAVEKAGQMMMDGGGDGGAERNAFTVTLKTADTENLDPGTYYHEAEVVDAAGNKSTVAVGAMTLHPTLLKGADGGDGGGGGGT